MRTKVAALVLILTLTAALCFPTLAAELDENGFYIAGDSLISYAGKDTEVVIPDGVTSISTSAFADRTAITSITIPDSVNYIGQSAFRGCTSLRSITIPNGVSTIYQNTFCGCLRLESVSLPAGLTAIKDYAFKDCAALTGIIIPDGVTTVGRSVFDGCLNLTSASIPRSLVNADYTAQYVFPLDCEVTVRDSSSAHVVAAPTATIVLAVVGAMAVAAAVIIAVRKYRAEHPKPRRRGSVTVTRRRIGKR